MGIDEIVAGAWAASRRAVYDELPVLVRPSIPVAWFGDLDAYLDSTLRVITVGLNPSRVEFPVNDPFSRFPRARGIADRDVLDGDRDEYIAALNEYFRTERGLRRAGRLLMMVWQGHEQNEWSVSIERLLRPPSNRRFRF